jgi:hypothetical protein
MSDNEPQRTDTAEVGGCTPKKSYSTPVVFEYGSLRELTREQSVNPSDGILGTSPAA